MKQFFYTIRDKAGIHARPAGAVVKKAKKYESGIQISKGEKKADAKDLLEVMGLGVRCQDEIKIEISGADEEAAYEEMKTIIGEIL